MMTASVTIETLQLVISVVGLLLVGIGSLAAAWWNLDSRRQATAKDLYTKIDTKASEVALRDLELKLERVKADTVTREELERLYRAIETHNARIESKMDQGFAQIGTRVDRLLVQRHVAD